MAVSAGYKVMLRTGPDLNMFWTTSVCTTGRGPRNASDPPQSICDAAVPAVACGFHTPFWTHTITTSSQCPKVSSADNCVSGNSCLLLCRSVSNPQQSVMRQHSVAVHRDHRLWCGARCGYTDGMCGPGWGWL